MSEYVYRRPSQLYFRRQPNVPLLLAATGDINGSAVITFSEAAALGALSAAAASASIDFTESAALDAIEFGDLNVSEAITFVTVGAIDDAAPDDITGSALIVFSETGGLDAFRFADTNGVATIAFTATLGNPPKGLTIRPPIYRSIDGKTLADAYNRGQKVTPDYQWPNGRNFYQDIDQT